MGSYKIIIDIRIEKIITRLPKNEQERIWASLLKLENQCKPKSAKSIKGYPSLLRIRVGSYRIVYTIKEVKLLILVLHIGHRKDVYRNLEPVINRIQDLVNKYKIEKY